MSSSSSTNTSAKRAAAKPAGAKRLAAKRIGSKSLVATPSGKKAVGKKTVGNKTVGKKAVGGKTVGNKSVGNKLVGGKSVGGKLRAAAAPGPRADFGAPIAGFFAKQPAPLRAILEELRDLIEAAVPDAESSIKWGMPFFTIDGAMMCALGGHKSHVNLILSGSPSAYADPDKLLTGAAKIGRHLKLTAADRVPRDAVNGWLATAAMLARAK